ncbi:hypothetical protein CEXT_279121 [Caerostris extrusa]|uniref:Uncharacterized protein n=1 Tax=Caerostris extrusa TaxID=172846 RepID=A0AAV4XK31_CAEEX|nr:hypothetical protein CEXT_279121 [Caerostris extrusa]
MLVESKKDSHTLLLNIISKSLGALIRQQDQLVYSCSVEIVSGNINYFLAAVCTLSLKENLLPLSALVERGDSWKGAKSGIMEDESIPLLESLL